MNSRLWVVHLALGLAALYAAIIAGFYFAQTWLLFPTTLAGAARVQLPASTQPLKVRTADGENLAGVRIPCQGGRAEGAPTLLGFGGNAWNAEAMALTLQRLLPDRDVVAFHYRGYALSSGSCVRAAATTPVQRWASSSLISPSRNSLPR